MDLKIKDVSEILRVSETTIRRWLSEGKIPAYKIQHQYRFNREEIEEWVLSCRLGHREGIREEQIYPQEEAGNQQFSFYRAVHHGEVMTDIASESKEQIIRDVVGRIAEKLSLDATVLAEMLIDRETMMSTALSNGTAVPHTRDFLLRRSMDVIVPVFLEKPIDWGALDGQPTHTLFFLLASSDKRHLHLLAKIAHISSNPDALALCAKRPDKETFLSFVKEWESTI